MCDIDYEPAKFDRRQVRRANKEHRCCACAETIRKGDRYHHTVLGGDGAPQAYKHCLRCWAICEALWEAGADLIDFGLNCGETWEEAERGPLPDEVARLAFLTPDEAQQQLRE